MTANYQLADISKKIKRQRRKRKDGRPDETIFAVMRNIGLASVELADHLKDSGLDDDYWTVRQAAEFYVNQDAADGLDFEKARSRINKARGAEKFRSTKDADGVKVHKAGFLQWMWQQRRKDLDQNG